MATFSPAARQLLDSGPLAHVVTLGADGSPHVSCTWVTRRDDALVIAVLTLRQKIANLRRDPRIAISCAGPGHNAMGLADYLVVHGHATVTEGGAAALLQEQAQLYMGPGVRFPDDDDPPDGYCIQVEVQRVWDHIGNGGEWSTPPLARS